MDLEKLSSRELYDLFGSAPKDKKGRDISPHIWMSKDQYKLYRRALDKEKKAYKREAQEKALKYYRGLSDNDLVHNCDGCYKRSCPCDSFRYASIVMRERKLI